MPRPLELAWTTGVLFLAACGQQGGATPVRQQTAKIAIVTDRSDGYERGDGAACAAVATLVTAALSEQSPFGRGDLLGGLGNNIDRNDPTVVELWGTGDRAMPGTPLRLAEGRLERPLGLEDYDATVLQRKRRAEGVAANFSTACMEAAIPQPVSPIYSAVRAAVSSLEASCTGNQECLLILQSDLVETFEPGLRSHVTAIHRRIPRPGAALPEPIDLRGTISVFLCGLAASTDVVPEAQRREIVALWRKHILIQPKRWVEQALCPGYRPQG